MGCPKIQNCPAAETAGIFASIFIIDFREKWLAKYFARLDF
jgi:hypothetical protein